MKKQNICGILLSVSMATLTMMGTQVVAAATFDSAGTIENRNRNEMMPIDENQIIIHSSNQGVISTKDPMNPFNGASGSCNGTMLLSMGKLSGGGYCSYKDTDGDTTIISFTATNMNDKGGNAGTWMLVGGTGKYAGASGGGEYNSNPNEDRTTSENTLTGKIELK